jgi:hypothetical protein
MAMLSLSFSFIHLEFSAAKSPKEHALVLSMIPFSARQKNDRTVHNAKGTRLLLLSSRSFFARASPGFDRQMQKQQTTAGGETLTFDYTFDIPVEVGLQVSP